MTDKNLPNSNSNDIVSENSEISNIDKVCILLLSMGEQAASSIIKKLDRDLVLAISENMSKMQAIRLPQVQDTFARFFRDYKEQSGLCASSRIYLQSTIEKALGSDIAQNVINSVYGDAIREKMLKLQWIDPARLSRLIENEHLQLQAIFIACLPAELAAEILSYFSEERQEEVLYRISRLRDLNKEVVKELEALIDKGTQLMSRQGAKIEGVKQVADIVNRLQNQQQNILEHLKKRDEETAAAVQEAMYDFYILSRQSANTLLKLIEDIPMDKWALALKGAENNLKKALFDLLPRRQLQYMQSIMLRLGPVSFSSVQQARKEIMAHAKELAEKGEIEIKLFDEKTVE